MNLYLFSSAVLLVLGLVTAYAQRNRLLRWSVVLLIIGAVPWVYISSLDLLGSPKPVEREFFRDSEKAQVLGFKILEGNGVYLLLDDRRWPIPYYYFIDWDEAEEMVGELRARSRQANREGRGLFLDKPFEGGYNSGSVDYPPPPKPDPPKGDAD